MGSVKTHRKGTITHVICRNRGIQAWHRHLPEVPAQLSNEMKTILTPQQALEQVRSGHLSKLKGLDEHDFTHVFDDAEDVILLTYHQNVQANPTAVIEENESEIREYAGNAKGVMLQLVCGHNHDLSMEDMTMISTVEKLFPQDTDISWDVEHSESTDFKLRIDLYIKLS